MVQRQVWRHHHCLVSEPECLTHSDIKTWLTHAHLQLKPVDLNEWEVIKPWWDKMTFKRDRVMKWKADSDFPGVLGGPINYRDRSELSRWWTADVCLLNDPPVLFLVHCHSSYWSTFTSHWLRGLALRHVLYRLKGEARPIIISIKLTRWPSEHFTAHHERQKYFIASKLLYLASGIFELELAIVEA